ncbi:MAG: hypothetical protein ABSG32_16270 [Terriglobia bacterium]
MPEWGQYRRFEFKRGDRDFLRQAGIQPCLIYDPSPEPLRKERRARFTEKDAEWLKACGISWERNPAVQLALNFCGRQNTME